MPGYGFSGKPTTTGWDCPRIARAWVVLMKRLGYTRYVAQGGDWGALITEQMGVQAPPELLGIHINLPSAVPADILKALGSGAAAPAGLSADEQRGLRPARLLLHPRPVVRPADGEPPADAVRDCGFTGRPGRLVPRPRLRELRAHRTRLRRATRGPHAGRRPRQHHAHLVDEHGDFRRLVSIGRTSFPFSAPKGVSIPVAVSAFPDELYQAPRSWAERAYPKLIHYNKLDKGGHFAAWEQPELFCRRFAPASDRCATSRGTARSGRDGVPARRLCPRARHYSRLFAQFIRGTDACSRNHATIAAVS